MKLRPEDEAQIAVVDYCAAEGLRAVHVANQGKRSTFAGYILVRMGLWKGFNDLLIFDRQGPGARGLLCVAEMKPPPKAGKRKPVIGIIKARGDQILVHQELRERGVPSFVWRSIEDARDDLRHLGVVLRVKL